MSNGPVILLIIDGFGLGKDNHSNPLYVSPPNYWCKLKKQFPTSKIKTHGTYVGLPDGQMGNSEVGHFTIGAGRVVDQDLYAINKLIENGQLFETEIIKEQIEKIKKSGAE